MKTIFSMVGKVNRLSILAVMTGMLFGIGGFTIYYGKGLSYLSSDPRACMNCHIMQSQFDSWQKASHHAVATCVDCHLPSDFFNKYLAKATNGFNHSEAFTLQNFHEPIQINKVNSEILQNNCLNCHIDLVNDLVHGNMTEKKDIRCVHCHNDAGHGEKTGLGGPLRQDETRSSL